MPLEGLRSVRVSAGRSRRVTRAIAIQLTASLRSGTAQPQGYGMLTHGTKAVSAGSAAERRDLLDLSAWRACLVYRGSTKRTALPASLPCVNHKKGIAEAIVGEHPALHRQIIPVPDKICRDWQSLAVMVNLTVLSEPIGRAPLRIPGQHTSLRYAPSPPTTLSR